jgi:hypothetical protein
MDQLVLFADRTISFRSLPEVARYPNELWLGITDVKSRKSTSVIFTHE